MYEKNIINSLNNQVYTSFYNKISTKLALDILS